MSSDSSRSWIDAAADLALENHRRHKAPDEPVICASGVSPSGPIHLGNLREVLGIGSSDEGLHARIASREIHDTDAQGDDTEGRHDDGDFLPGGGAPPDFFQFRKTFVHDGITFAFLRVEYSEGWR